MKTKSVGVFANAKEKRSLYLREPMNGFTHFLGFILAILGTYFLLSQVLSIEGALPLQVGSISIYCLSMISVFLTSTLYHWLPLDKDNLLRMRKIDHIVVFLSIAGSYTPLCLIVLKGTLGFGILVSIWLLVLMGITFKLFWLDAPRYFSGSVYFIIGSLHLVAIKQTYLLLGFEALSWFIASGFFFLLGTLVYVTKKPDPYPGILGFHEIFHLITILASFCFYWMVYRFMIGNLHG